MKVYACVYCREDLDGRVKSENVSRIFSSAKSAIRYLENIGYKEASEHNKYDEFCIWQSNFKPFDNTEGGSSYYITTYVVHD